MGGDNAFEQRPRQKLLIKEMVDQVDTGIMPLEDLKQQIFYTSGYVAYVKNDDRTFYLACPED